MGSLADWANHNNGFAIVVLTFVSVLTTFIMAGLSWNANRISSKNLKQALLIEKERHRPYLVFDIEHRQSLLYATLKNMGNTGAFNVTVKIDPPLESNFGRSLKQSGLTSKNISFVAPQRNISDLIGTGPEFYKRYPEPKFEGYIEYHNSDGTKYQDRFLLDLGYLLELTHTVEPEIGKEMQKLVKEMKDISRTTERLQKVVEHKFNTESV